MISLRFATEMLDETIQWAEGQDDWPISSG
jgi:hypothetical protein